MRSGARLGDWRLVEPLGRGGNGEVWRCAGSDGSEAAIKVLLDQNNRERLGRFRNEISFLLDHGRRPGVVPILDHDLTGNGKVWYVMPLAVPIREALGPDAAPAMVVDALAAITQTLAELADRGIAHRDLKPDNLMCLDGVWSVGDFGLVKYPASAALTVHGRRLGPIDYMAPEMRDSPDTADPELADVHSIAKTLWVLLTGLNLPFPGQHRPELDICRLTARLDYRWAPHLDLLLERCTDHDPGNRPRMHEVADELAAMTRPVAAAPTVDSTADLERRIAEMTDLQRRRDEDQASFRTRTANAWDHLLDDVTRPAYRAFADRLPNFKTRDPVQAEIPRSLMMLPSTNLAPESWGGMIFSPGSTGVRVDLGVALHLRDRSGRCTISAVVRVNRHNQSRGHTVTVLEQMFDTTVGSASFDATLAEVRLAFAGCIAETLATVEDALEAERQLASAFEHGDTVPFG